MVRHEVALQDFAVLLGSQGMKDLSQSGAYLAIEHFLSHLGDKDEMILAVPLAVGQAVVGL